MNKIIVREPDNNEGEMILIIANELGEIVSEQYLTYEDFSADVLCDIIALTKQYAPFTLHFITEDDVNKYLALASISEYPEVDDEKEDDDLLCDNCTDTSCEYNVNYDPYAVEDDDEYEDEYDEDYEDEEDEDEYTPHVYQPIIDDFEGDPCANCNDKGCACNTYVPPTVKALSSAIENASRD